MVAFRRGVGARALCPRFFAFGSDLSVTSVSVSSSFLPASSSPVSCRSSISRSGFELIAASYCLIVDSAVVFAAAFDASSFSFLRRSIGAQLANDLHDLHRIGLAENSAETTDVNSWSARTFGRSFGSSVAASSSVRSRSLREHRRQRRECAQRFHGTLT
jgi:hypothetical protein